jgi:RNA polymerase sigma-70 factor (ECF subfamily)
MRVGLDRPNPTTMPEPAQDFWREVRRLPYRQAQAITLRYLDDLSMSEIAAVMEAAEGTVRALLTQGRSRLARQLKAKGLIDT